MEDWRLHLSTLFPEVRLKHYIELRCADANRFAWAGSFPAIFLGVFEESSLLEAASDLTRKLSWAERMTLQVDVARNGLEARCRKIKIIDLARELVQIAAEGLKKRGKGEVEYIAPLNDYLAMDVNDRLRQIGQPKVENLESFLLRRGWNNWGMIDRIVQESV